MDRLDDYCVIESVIYFRKFSHRHFTEKYTQSVLNSIPACNYVPVTV